MALPKSFNISKPVLVTSPVANVDALYGPWASVEEACLNIPIARRRRGLTIAVETETDIEEYQWKVGIADENLVRKVEQMSLTLRLYGSDEIIADEGEDIYGQFVVEGVAGIKRAVLYQLVNGNETYVQEYSGIGKGTPNTFTIPTPAMSGVYTYRIKVLDSLDNYAITSEDTNYIQYSVLYGGISTVYNLSQLNAITVKNFNSVAGVPFQINISVRDESFTVSSVHLTNENDETAEVPVDILLTPYDDAYGQVQSDTFIGNHYYFMPESSELQYLDGQMCSVTIKYVDNQTPRQKTRDLFRLLSISTLELIPEYEGSDYYEGLPGYYIFQLQSGVENLSVALLPDANSDFDFERCTVLTYRRFTLKVIPKNVEKNNAHLIINWVFNYAGQDYNGTFDRVIGNILPVPKQSYYEPPASGLISRDTIIYADQNHYTDTDLGQYYLVITDNQSSTGRYSPSFVLDTYCKINQMNDKSVKYITVTYGGVEIAKVTEDEISTQWSNLYTDTPLNEWTQIGIGINLEESFQRGDEPITGSYHAIYINGMVVKTMLVSESDKLKYNASSELVVTIGNGILVQKCFLYYRNNGQEIMDPTIGNQNVDSIIYNNYKSHKLNFAEPTEALPLLKFLRITGKEEMTKYYRLINEYKTLNEEDPVKYLTTFGKIGDEKAQNMGTYDSGYDKNATWQTLLNNDTFEHNSAELFRQHVEIKKPAQKEYGVLCKAQWMGNVFQDVIVEVHTQGTSTLVYAVPNFKFTFWRLTQKEGEDAVERYKPPFIKIEGTDPAQYYEESIYTAKADFMDSAHLNNTPTCNYYNGLIQALITRDPSDPNGFQGSPAARNNKLDAILGFPIVMEISDTANDFTDIFTNIGSFMLNIDKTGDSLGFEINDGVDTLSCISFEGTSNDNNTGSAGRFDIPSDMVSKLPPYINVLGQVDEAKIAEHQTYVKNNILKKKGPNDSMTYEGQTMLVQDFPYIAWCKFLSDGLEYRYPDSDIYKEDGDVIKKCMSASDFTNLYKMWWWVYTSDSLDAATYRTQFAEHFNTDYCKLYFIQLMIYAQTDNLGKNAMFDYWDGPVAKGGGRWYPRPYDLDSEAGLDNNGNDNIASFVEIRPSFSLNYDVQKENNWEWRADNYLIDDNDVAEHPDLHLTKSVIRYGQRDYDRYHFSSNKSKLWITFYKNFKSEIEGLYIKLRNEFAYNPDSIINLCESTLINKLGTNQYNLDFRNKYLGTSDQSLAYGNRWYKFKKWLTKRFAFCDSYFGAAETASYNITNRISYQMKLDSPQYVWQQYQGNPEIKFVLDDVSYSTGSAGATKFSLFVNQPSVFETTLFKYASLQGGATNYKNLLKLDVSGNKADGFTSITGVTGNSLDNLKWLNISDSNVQTLSLPPNVKTLLAERIQLNSLTIPEGAAAEEMSFAGTTFLGAVSFSVLPNLKSLDISDCVFEQNVVFADLPNLETLTMNRTIFKGDVIISDRVNVRSFNFRDLTVKTVAFSGSNLVIDEIDFRNTQFTDSVLNLDPIRQNIKRLYFDSCKGLVHLQLLNNDPFGSLTHLGLTGSSIKALGRTADSFDCSFFSNLSGLKKTNGSTFNFQTCTNIESITNISWDNTGDRLFADCRKLVSITGNVTFKDSVYCAFYRCNRLTTLPTYTITSDNSNRRVTDGQYIFAGCRDLSYSVIETFIRSCTKVTDFSSAVRAKQMNENQTISLTNLFENNTAVESVDSMFSTYDSESYDPSGASNKIVVTGKLPASVKTASWMFYRTTISVPYDILYNDTNLTTANHMFAYCTITFTDPAQETGVLQPTIIDNEVSVPIRYGINKDFFVSNKAKLVNVSRMFFGTNVIVRDDELFNGFANLEDTSSTFGSGGMTRYTFKHYNNVVEDLPLDVVNMWNNSPKITNIAGCFVNVYNVYCTGLNFSKTTGSINISCLFGISDANYRSSYPCSINVDSINVTLLTTGLCPHISTNITSGTFQNRTITLTSANSTIFSNGKMMYGDCSNTFKGANIRMSHAITTLDLSSVTNCTSLFEGSRLYVLSAETGHTYGLNDRKFVDITMPTNCGIYTYMFRNSSILKELPALRASNASNLSFMYAGCVINTADLELPSDYFDVCKDSLTNTSYMFYYNMYLTSLEYDANKGLFEGCKNLSNVGYMFRTTYFLHKGIPNNLFGVCEIDSDGTVISGVALTKLTSLQYMFAESSVLYDITNPHKCIDANTFTPLTKLADIPGMFFRNYLREVNGPTGYSATMIQKVEDTSTVPSTWRPPISPSTWMDRRLNNISNLFEHCKISPEVSLGKFKFKGFTIGTDAFFSSSIGYIDDPFVDDQYVSTIARADRMFYQSLTGPYREPDTGTSSKMIVGLAEFINKVKDYPNTNINNIAGGVNDPNSLIPVNYKQKLYTSDGEEKRYWGWALVYDADPEGHTDSAGNRANYGNYPSYPTTN